MSLYSNNKKRPGHEKLDASSFVNIISFVLLAICSLNVLSVEQGNETPDKYNNDHALEISQAALNNVVVGHKFVNQDNKPVDITQYQGKPLLISLIYTSCHHICPTLTTHLAEVVEIARDALGQESFSIITVGFDTAFDSPERMRLYSRERNINISAWDFLSGDKQTIEALAKDLGFIYFKSAKGFDHLSQVSLLDAEGKLYRQIYGVKYDPKQLVEPLKELVFGKRSEQSAVQGWINNIRLFCTIYDPRSGRYTFDYSIFVGIIIGIFILAGIATFIVREWRQNNIDRAS